MALTHLLKTIPLSFYSSSLYREVADQWRGRSLVYLFVLWAICWIFIAFVITNLLVDVVGYEVDHFATQMPVIHLEKGIASTEEPGPFFLKNSIDKKVWVVVDTHNKHDISEQNSARVLLRQNVVLIKKGESHMKTLPFSEELTLDFGPKELKARFKEIRKWIMTIVYLPIYSVGLILTYVYYLLQSLVFGVIGLSFSSLLKRKLSYWSLVSLSIISMTPTTILNTIFFFWREQINYFLIATFLLSIGYLFFAVKVNPSKKNIGKLVEE